MFFNLWKWKHCFFNRSLQRPELKNISKYCWIPSLSPWLVSITWCAVIRPRDGGVYVTRIEVLVEETRNGQLLEAGEGSAAWPPCLSLGPVDAHTDLQHPQNCGCGTKSCYFSSIFSNRSKGHRTASGAKFICRMPGIHCSSRLNCWEGWDKIVKEMNVVRDVQGLSSEVKRLGW